VNKNNNTLKYRIALVILIAPSKSCINPNSKFSTKINETLETLGPKCKNAWNYNTKLDGGVLKDSIHSYYVLIPKFQVPSDETSQIGRSYKKFGNPRRGIQFLQEREDG
jgi:hypothetical protein